MAQPVQAAQSEQSPPSPATPGPLSSVREHLLSFLGRDLPPGTELELRLGRVCSRLTSSRISLPASHPIILDRLSMRSFVFESGVDKKAWLCFRDELLSGADTVKSVHDRVSILDGGLRLIEVLSTETRSAQQSREGREGREGRESQQAKEGQEDREGQDGQKERSAQDGQKGQSGQPNQPNEETGTENKQPETPPAQEAIHTTVQEKSRLATLTIHVPDAPYDVRVSYSLETDRPELVSEYGHLLNRAYDSNREAREEETSSSAGPGETAPESKKRLARPRLVRERERETVETEQYQIDLTRVKSREGEQYEVEMEVRGEEFNREEFATVVLNMAYGKRRGPR